MKKVLIVIDMQNDFINGALGSIEAQTIVPNVVEKVKNWDGELLFTRDTHYEDYMNTLEGQKLPVPHCIYKTAGWQIIDELTPFIKYSYDIIDKRTFGFEGWRHEILDRYVNDISALSELDITLIGVCTDICVISNALALRMFYPNAKITVDASCCAGVTPEKHAAALEVMKSCQIDVINE